MLQLCSLRNCHFFARQLWYLALRCILDFTLAAFRIIPLELMLKSCICGALYLSEVHQKLVFLETYHKFSPNLLLSFSHSGNLRACERDVELILSLRDWRSESYLNDFGKPATCRGRSQLGVLWRITVFIPLLSI